MATAADCCARLLVAGSVVHGAGASSKLRIIPCARLQRHPSICCKSRRKSPSSQLKKKRSMKISDGKSPSITRHSSHIDETNGFQIVSSEIIPSSNQLRINSEIQDASASIASTEKNSDEIHPVPIEAIDELHLVSKHDGNDLESSLHLKDFMGMIRSIEKNVLLLNEARTHAVEELEKVRAEKDLLEREIKNLQTKFEQDNPCNKDSVRTTVCSVMAEDITPYLYGNGNGVLGTKTSFINKNSSYSSAEELRSLREENLFLKNEVGALKMKLLDAQEISEHAISPENKRSLTEASAREMESGLSAQEAASEISSLKSNCKNLLEKKNYLQKLLDKATLQADQAADVLTQNNDLEIKIKMLEVSLEEAKDDRYLLDKTLQDNKLLQDKVKSLEVHLEKSEKEISSHIVLYQAAVKEFQETLEQLNAEIKRKSFKESSKKMSYQFWSSLLLMLDGWLLEKKISASDAKLLREMAWKRDSRIRDAYSSCEDKTDDIIIATLLKLKSSSTSPRMHIIHIAAEMAPVCKVGGLGDVVSGISKALQKRGHMLEIILPKYDCMNEEQINDMKMLDVVIPSYFDGQLYQNRIWVGTVEGLPVYFIEPQHPAKFFTRGKFYGEHDDFKRFSFFSRAALELLYQAGKRADIIHCHDWHTAFIAPLYWDIYATRGFDSARICFTCHNFEYQGVAPASELASCGLVAHHMNRQDRLKDNSSHDRVNPVKGAIVFSNIVTTVSPTYAQEIRTPEGGKGLHETLQIHSRKFVGILNGIDSETWNPSTDVFLRFQYSADNIEGKMQNKIAIREKLQLSSYFPSKPLVCCITRLVPQKGVHLIRHAIYQTVELGGQFVLLGSNPVPHIQREFEAIANQFDTHGDVRLILKYDDVLSHLLYAASDMIVIPSIFEPCGLTQMIAMRYGSVPIARRTGGLNDSVFDMDDGNFPIQIRNGFTFLMPDEQGLNKAMERAFKLYMTSPDDWRQLVCRNMQADYSWDASSVKYEQLYEKSVARARAVTHKL